MVVVVAVVVVVMMGINERLLATDCSLLCVKE